MCQNLARRRLLALPALIASPVAAQGDLIRLVVPFPAGGGTDVTARLVAAAWSTRLGRVVVVENRPGAGGNIGAESVARSPADGRTVLFAQNGILAINPALYGHRMPLDVERDLAPVGLALRVPFLVVVRPESPFSQLAALAQHLRNRPAQAISFASGGVGTTSHLGGEILAMQAGGSALHVPYRGGAAAVTDLIAGRVDFMVEAAPSVVPHLLAGRLRGLAVAGTERLAALPHVPTAAEAGMPDLDVSAWGGLAVPAGTPRAIIAQHAAALAAALGDAELRASLARLSTEILRGGPDEMAALAAAERPRWAAAVARSGARAE